MSTRTITIDDRSELAEGDVVTFEWDVVSGVFVTGTFLGSDGPEWRINQHDAEGREMFVSRIPKGSWTLRGATREVPEWEPGTTGTATVRGVLSTRVIRLHPNVQDGEGGYAWASVDLVDGKHKEINGYDGTFLHTEDDVTGFSPDSTKTRLTVTKAVTQEELADVLAQHYGDHNSLADVDHPTIRQNYLDDARNILNMLGGGTR